MNINKIGTRIFSRDEVLPGDNIAAVNIGDSKVYIGSVITHARAKKYWTQQDPSRNLEHEGRGQADIWAFWKDYKTWDDTPGPLFVNAQEYEVRKLSPQEVVLYGNEKKDK